MARVDYRELERLGLTKNESKAYLALLGLGSSTATPIARKAGLYSSKTYAALDGLMAKGLVSYVVKDGKRVFRAEDPKNILSFMAEKRKKIDEQEKEAVKLVRALEGMGISAEKGNELFVYEGMGGLKSLYRKIYSILQRGETHYVFGAPRSANELVEAFLIATNRRRVQKGITLRIIYNPDAREFGKRRQAMRFTHVKYFTRPSFIAPTCFEVFRDFTALYYVTHSEIKCFAIRNKEIAKSMRNFFDVIWNSDYVEV